MGIWDCGSPLYDSYELVSVTHIIDRHLMSLPYQLSGRSKRNVFLARSLSRANDQVVPTTTIASNSSSRKGTPPSCEASASAAMVATSFDYFDVIRKLWKKKVNLGITGTGRRKEHPEKTRTWLSALLKRIGFRKKRNNIRMHD